MLPIAKSLFLLTIATKPAVSSGRDVPMATTVIPIIVSSI